MAKPSLYAGVDLGGTKIQSVVLRNRVAAGSDRVPTPSPGPDEVIAAMAASVRSSLQAAGAGLDELAAVGVGSPGAIDGDAGTVSHASNVPGFSATVPVAAELSRALHGPPVVLDNDVRVAVLAEYRRGAGRGFGDLLGVAMGTGVGGGLVLGGRLRDGRGAAGEIGHAIVKDGGRLCSCGRRGCLEAYAGRGRMEATARRWVTRGRPTDLFRLMKKAGRDRLTSGVIAQALEKGDPMAVRLIDDAVWAMGLALASAQNLLDLEAITIGGGLGDRLGQPFADRVGASMLPHLFRPEQPPKLLASTLGDLAGAIGAALRATGHSLVPATLKNR